MSVTTTTPLVLALSDLAPDHGPRVGGKAASLGELASAGFPVPEGFVLTTDAFERFLDESGLRPLLVEIERRAATGGLSLDESWAGLVDLRAKIQAKSLPPDIRTAVEEAWRARFTDDVALAVRSSGTKEDLAGSSFAGQYETVLGVRGFEPLEAAIKRCWGSVFKNRVQQYSTSRAGGASGLGMAVVVQRLVEADVSGVLFTVNPVTGRERESVVEAVFGLGEALVSGKTNADRFVLDTRTGEVLARSIAEKRIAILPGPQGAAEQELPPERAKATTLDDALLGELASLSGAVMEHYGRPMDVEWVVAAGKLQLVQARPITKLSFAPDTGEWTTADFRDGGVSSDVCSPFMWSLYESVLEATLPTYFKLLRLVAPEEQAKWSRSFFARPYWNLGEVKRALEKVPDYNERDFDTGLGVKIEYEGPGKTTPVTVGGILRALPVLFALGRSYREQLATDEAFVAAWPLRKKEFDLEPEELARLDRLKFAVELRRLITGLYFETESTYFYTIYNTSNAKTDLKPAYDAAKAACGGDLDQLKLVGGLQDISHLRPIKDLHATVRALRDAGKAVDDETVRAFARRWRFHSRKELDIRVPRYEDDLPFVRTQLEEALAAFDEKRDPETQARAQHAAYEAELRKALAALRWRPFARRSFRKKLELVRKYAWWREEMRDHSTFAYYLVRLWAVEAARRLVAERLIEKEDDVWYLVFQDVLAAVEGALPKDEVRARVRAGRRVVRSFRSFDAPGEIGGRHGFAAAAPGPPPEGALTGIGCSPGRVEARARVVKKLEEAKKVEKGDVLVTVFTDPGWTPLLGRVAAVVTETGGMLSHAAVISREYGIPAVLAVARATEAIRDDDVVIIDGTAGTVQVKRS